MKKNKEAQFLDFLADYITENKRTKINEVLKKRTRYLTVVLEDIFKEHNASAVVRTCECLGIQDLHAIQNRYEFNVNPDVVRGSSNWIDIFHYREPELNNTEVCYHRLKEQGYKIFATSTSLADTGLDDVTLDHKTAIVFGTELEGLSDYALENADGCLKIRMYGFTESYNLSVCVAICMSQLVENLRHSEKVWKLKKNELEAIKLEWFKRIVKKSETLEKAFFK